MKTFRRIIKQQRAFLFVSVITLTCISCKDKRVTEVDKIISTMTLEEKASIVVGAGMERADGESTVVGNTHHLVPGAAGTTVPIPRLDIPAIVCADGPAGLRILPHREGNEQTYYCTAFPIATALASSWNTELVEEVGKALGNEVREYGVDIWLGPGMNIHRNPLHGRTFEYYSEDPLVTGKIAAAMINGVQFNGVGTSPKHFAANNQEVNRMYSDTRVTPRALREIYLKGFEIAVKESSPWTVMSSYNMINNTYSAHNKELLTTILRDEWGFEGFVMTDWFGGKNPITMIQAGNDLMMPGLPQYKEAILNAIKEGTLSEETLNDAVRRILSIIIQSPRYNKYKNSDAPDLKGHAKLVRRAAAEGIILLENKNTLPLTAEVKNIAVYGVTSYNFIAGGSGSGDVNKAYSISLIDGLENAGYKYDRELKDRYEKHIQQENEKNKPDADDSLAPFLPGTRPTEILPEQSLLRKQAKDADIALITIGRATGEFVDRKVEDDFKLTLSEQKLIEDVCNVFHAERKKVVVVLNIGGVIETTSWKNKSDAVVLAWQGGQEAGNAVVDVLSGNINPSGKLTMTFPNSYMDVPSATNFPYNYEPKYPVEIGMGRGKVEEDQQLRNVDYTVYEEDIYVGYRYFDTFDKEVSYPFGYGLSYTTFGFNKPSVTESKGEYVLKITITNNGQHAGKEVVQAYVTAPDPSANKPRQELKAFVKTGLLQPGASETVTLRFNSYDLASFNPDANAWITDAGSYKVAIGTSSRDIREEITFEINTVQEVKVHNVLNQMVDINKLKK
ncbi:beta-glucosidase [Bacteroides sp. 519]|uniref:beta-glucosidase family protein n=1 Tax=Bacteroides sp. 519 TaxID=2302937 RepID=UPI0013D68586|nr:beta-glucosidase [Bacteroides sp. 519]NDV57037.1 beta-glucosidase [Bacteroides sp. 519]